MIYTTTDNEQVDILCEIKAEGFNYYFGIDEEGVMDVYHISDFNVPIKTPPLKDLLTKNLNVRVKRYIIDSLILYNDLTPTEQRIIKLWQNQDPITTNDYLNEIL